MPALGTDTVWFRCNIVGGCRLSDLDMNVRSGEIFSLTRKEANGSKSVRAARRDKWLVEMTEEDAYERLERGEGTPKEEAKTAEPTAMAKPRRIEKDETAEREEETIKAKPLGRQIELVDDSVPNTPIREAKPKLAETKTRANRKAELEAELEDLERQETESQQAVQSNNGEVRRLSQ